MAKGRKREAERVRYGLDTGQAEVGESVGVSGWEWRRC